MNGYPKLCKAEVMDNYSLLLFFSNDEKKIFDFKPNLNHPYYKNLRNITLFKNVAVNDGEIEWATGQDFCPHTLYEKSVSYTDPKAFDGTEEDEPAPDEIAAFAEYRAAKTV